MEASWLSLLPFFIVIGSALWVKNILPGLVMGLIVGSLAVEMTWLGGLRQSVHYIVQTLSEPENIKIIGFLYLFGGLIGLMQIAGGIKGFVEWLRHRLEGRRALYFFIWFTLPFTFMAPMFRIMMIGPVIRSLSKEMRLNPRKIGYLMDISTEPFIVLLPAATAFVGFMVSILEMALQQNGIEQSAYRVFLLSLPLNLFAVLLFGYGLIVTFWQMRLPRRPKTGPVRSDSSRGNRLHRSGIRKELSLVRAQPWHAVYPLVLLLVFTFYFLWENGRQQGAVSFFEALALADATWVMLIAIFTTLVFTVFAYVLRKKPLNELVYHFFDGGNQLMQAIVLLVLVWSVTQAAEDLGFSTLISGTLGSFLPGFVTPAVLFLLGSFVAYFVGSSWGVWGLLMPLGISLAQATGASVPMAAGAVFASGTFGAFASPLGDTTITTASILNLTLIDYARYKLKTAVGVGCVAAILYIGLAVFI